MDTIVGFVLQGVQMLLVLALVSMAGSCFAER